MKNLLVLAFLVTGCGDSVVETLDMNEPVPLDLSADVQPSPELDSSSGLGPHGLKLPPCARPEIDQCLGPPDRQDRLGRPIEKEMK